MSQTRNPNPQDPNQYPNQDPLYYHPSRDPAIHPELYPSQPNPDSQHDQAHRPASVPNINPPRRPDTSVTYHSIFKMPEIPSTHSYNLRPRPPK